MAGQTLDALAAMLEVPVETLRKLNQMSETDQPKVGQEVLIPGQLMYHSQGREGYLQVAMYGVQTPQNIPYKPETIRMQQQPLAKDQTLTEFAEKHGVKEAFLREMNGLKADEEVPAHTMLLVEYSCELTDKATVDAIVTTFQVDRDRFRRSMAGRKTRTLTSSSGFTCRLASGFGTRWSSRLSSPSRLCRSSLRLR